MRACLNLAALGASLGVLLDAVHVWNGVLMYPSPTFVGIALWTFPLYALASIGLGLVPVVMFNSSPSVLLFEYAMTVFCIAYLLSSVLRGWMCAFCMSTFAALNWKLVDECSVQGLGHSLLAAITGSFVEVVLVSRGAFTHFETDLLGCVPVWLPVLYMVASPAIRAYSSFLLHGRSIPTLNEKPKA
jgi:hypothetical protein